MKGDEIMVINGAIVSDLDMMFIESVLQEELTLCMMLRSSRTGITYFTSQLCIMESHNLKITSVSFYRSSCDFNSWTER